MIFSNIRLLRELLRIIHKFQTNFGIRAVVNCPVEGLLENYLQSVFEFTISCLRCNLDNKRQVMNEVMAHLNVVWQRFSFEIIQSKAEGQQKVELYVEQIIQT